MKKYLIVLTGIMLYGTKVQAQPLPLPVTIPAIVVASSFTVAGGTATITVSSPTTTGSYSSGYYNYVTNVHIEMYATGTLTGGATPYSCTITGLPTTLKYYFQSAAATGTMQVLDMQFANPLLSTQGAQLVFNCPGQASVAWNLLIGSYQAN